MVNSNYPKKIRAEFEQLMFDSKPKAILIFSILNGSENSYTSTILYLTQNNFAQAFAIVSNSYMMIDNNQIVILQWSNIIKWYSSRDKYLQANIENRQNLFLCFL